MVLRSDSGTKEAWTLAALCPGRQLEPLVGSSVGLKLGFAVGLWLGRKLGRKLGRMVRAFFRARWQVNFPAKAGNETERSRRSRWCA